MNNTFNANLINDQINAVNQTGKEGLVLENHLDSKTERAYDANERTLNEIFFGKNIVDISALKETKYFKREVMEFSGEIKEKIDLSGNKEVTDLNFWNLYQTQIKNENLVSKIPEEIILNGCSSISIWSIHYLNKIRNKNLLSLPSKKVI